MQRGLRGGVGGAHGTRHAQAGPAQLLNSRPLVCRARPGGGEDERVTPATGDLRVQMHGENGSVPAPAVAPLYTRVQVRRYTRVYLHTRLYGL